MNEVIAPFAAPVAIGDRYKQRCRGRLIWEVSKFYTDPKGIEHVQLRELGNRVDRKTLALLEFLRSAEFLRLSA